MMPYIFQTLVFAYCVQKELCYTARDGNGREWLVVVQDRTRKVFNLSATRGYGTGMDLSQRDGMRLVMIFIPVSLSTVQVYSLNRLNIIPEVINF